MLMKMPGLVMMNLIWGWLMTWLSVIALGKLSKCCVCGDVHHANFSGSKVF